MSETSPRRPDTALAPPAPPPPVGAPPGGDPGISARSAGLRLALLFGPAVFGVTAAGVALPEVSAALGAPPSSVVWVLTAHALALGVGTALFGRLADSLGARRTLLIGAVLLVVGTVVCLVAPALGVVVAGRFVLAAGSGAMSAVALALAASSPPDRRPAVLMIFGAAMAFFAAGATLAGGVVTAGLSWRVTLVLPALSLAAVPLCLRLASARTGSGRPMDLAGAGLLTLAAGSLLVLIQAPALVLPPTAVVVTAVLGLLGAGLLVARTVRRTDGFIPASLVTSGPYLLAVAVGSGVYAGLFAAMFGVPRILFDDYDWSVLEVGLWLLPGAVVAAVLSRMAGRRGTSVGVFLVTGTALAGALLLGAYALVGGGPALLVLGTSGALAAFAVTQVVMTGFVSPRVPLPQRGAGMGLLNLTFFLGGAVGSAAAGALFGVLGPAPGLAAVMVLPLLSGLLALALTRFGDPEA